MSKDKLKLDCTNCGAPLYQTDKKEIYTCEKCDTSYKVTLGSDGINLTKVEERIGNIEELLALKDQRENLGADLILVQNNLVRSSGHKSCAFKGLIVLLFVVCTFILFFTILALIDGDNLSPGLVFVTITISIGAPIFIIAMYKKKEKRFAELSNAFNALVKMIEEVDNKIKSNKSSQNGDL